MNMAHPRPLGIALTAALCAACALATPAGAAKSHPRRAPLTPGSRYLALGDSVTFGYEEAQVVPAPNYKDAASFLGYPEHFGAALHVKVANAACPGETSSSLINAQAQSNGCENSVGSPTAYRKLFPLHVHYSGSQLAYAISYLKAHKNVRLVSLMIGANDFFVCVRTTKDGCTSGAEIAALLKKISSNVKVILSAIRNKAHYKGQLAIVNYYSLNYASTTSNLQSQTLNSNVDSAAKPFHVEIANGYAELQAAALHFGGSTCGAGLLTQLGSPGNCGVHPSYAGQALLAQALAKAVKL
jgi:lysophospholipase L1-like esterase